MLLDSNLVKLIGILTFTHLSTSPSLS